MKKTFDIEVDCAMCAEKCQKAIAALDGVEDCQINFILQKLTLTADDARYSVILNSNIVKTLSAAFGVADLKTADLAAGAGDYLKSIGLSDEDLANLKKNLSAKPETSSETETPAEAEPETPSLIAPAPESADTTYVVVAGDCLWNLAWRFYNNPLKWKTIADVNQLRNPHLIFVGQTLKIPA